MMPPVPKRAGKADPFMNERILEVIAVIISLIYLVWNKSWFNVNKVGLYIVGER